MLADRKSCACIGKVKNPIRQTVFAIIARISIRSARVRLREYNAAQDQDQMHAAVRVGRKTEMAN